jgi:acyl-CoA thioesterase-1
VDRERPEEERWPNDGRAWGEPPSRHVTWSPGPESEPTMSSWTRSSTARQGRPAVLLAALLLPALLLPTACTSAAGPPPTQAVRYLALGDSITDGFGVPGAYRTVLWQRLVERDHDRIDFVGSESGGPPRLGDQDHEGHPGWCIDGPCSGSGTDLELPRVDDWMRRSRPDVVSVHLGTNDLLRGASGATVAERLDRLLTRIYADGPDTHVVVVQIIDVADRPEHDAYDALVPQVAAKHRAEGRRTTVVDLSDLLSIPADYRDGVHPTQAGYDRMGEALYPAISAAYREVG